MTDDLYQLRSLLNDALEYIKDHDSATDAEKCEEAIAGMIECLKYATYLIETASHVTESVQVGSFTMMEEMNGQAFPVTVPDYREKEIYRAEDGLAFAAQIKQVTKNVESEGFDSAKTTAAIESLLQHPYYVSLTQSLHKQEMNQRDE